VGHTLAAHCHVQPDVAIDGLDGLVHLAQLRQWQAQEGVGRPVYGVLVQVLIVSCRVQCGFDFTVILSNTDTVERICECQTHAGHHTL
jgi:hypothetical protein